MARPVRKQKRGVERKSCASANRNAAQLVYEHAPLMRTFVKIRNPAARQEILRASPKIVQALSNVAHNASLGVIKLPGASARKQLTSKDFLAFSNPKLSHAKKRALLLKRRNQQSGGFFPILAKLLPIAISLVSGLFGGSSRSRQK